MATIELQKRDEVGTTAVKRLRKKALVPGVLYGDHIDSRNFMLALNEVPKLKKAGKEQGLIDVHINGETEPVKAIIQKVQTDPVTGVYEHVDLYQVRMDKKLHTDLRLEFVGESEAVKDLGGILLKQFDKIPIECLPKDLVQILEVPIDSLNTFDDAIRVSDLQFPEGVVTHIDTSLIIASVSAPRSEEELEELTKDVEEGEGPEVTTAKLDEEGEEGAEGEATSDKEQVTSEDNEEKPAENKEEKKDK